MSCGKKPRRSASWGHPQYHFDCVDDGECRAGLILYWKTERFIYVWHFCIFSEMRGWKYGQRTLKELNEKGKTIILEIDPPVEEISIRRKGFYERCGFMANLYSHTHPAYHRECGGPRAGGDVPPGKADRETVR